MAGWRACLEQVARERYPRLLARAVMLVGDRGEAEDLVQEALAATFAAKARFDSMAEAEAYVRRAIVSRSIDGGKRRAAERRALARLRLERVSPSEVDVPELAPDVEEALLDLPPRERACVVLRHLEDLSVAQTARELGLSDGAVKRYTADGVTALNAALGTSTPRGESMALEEGRHHA